MVDEETKVCPDCGGKVLPIAYGYPGPEMWEAEQRGEIVLGGCTVDPGLPTSVCTGCRRQLGTLR